MFLLILFRSWRNYDLAQCNSSSPKISCAYLLLQDHDFIPVHFLVSILIHACFPGTSSHMCTFQDDFSYMHIFQGYGFIHMYLPGSFFIHVSFPVSFFIHVFFLESFFICTYILGLYFHVCVPPRITSLFPYLPLWSEKYFSTFPPWHL